MFGVAAIVIAGVIVGLVVAFRHTTSTSTIAGPLPTSQVASTPQVTSDTDTSVATSPTFTRPSTVPPPYNGNSVVSVAPGAGSDPTAPTVVALLTRYFTDISERNFADYFTLYTTEVRAALDQAQVAAGYRSTEVSAGRLTHLSTTGDGRLAATVTFTSMQDAADGPDGQTCTHWKVDFFLENVGAATYLFGAPPSNYQAEHVAC